MKVNPKMHCFYVYNFYNLIDDKKVRKRYPNLFIKQTKLVAWRINYINNRTSENLDYATMHNGRDSSTSFYLERFKILSV